MKTSLILRKQVQSESMNGFIHYEKVSQRFSILEESRDFVSLHMGRPDLPLPLFEKVLQMLIKMTGTS